MVPMLLALALAAQVPDTATFSSPALAEIVRRAQLVNRVLPPDLVGFTTTAETEATFLANLNVAGKGSLGGTRQGSTEAPGQIEQFASTVRWTRREGGAQHIVGYRSVSSAIVPAVRGFLQESWIIPTLYGDTVPIFVGQPDSTGRRRGRGMVHPFGADGERLYRFTGGDTIVTLDLPGQRQATVVHLMVEPKDGAEGERRLVFVGDVYLDVVSAQVVRLKGRAYSVGRRREGGLSVQRVLRATTGLQPLAFLDLENRFEGGEFWLPGTQRLELQVTTALSDSRLTIRIVSEFGDYEVDDPPLAPDSTLLAAVPPYVSPLVTEASADSLAGFGAWDDEIGAKTQATNAYDFDAYMPSWRRPTGRPALAIQLRRFDEFFHYNRVEGAFTGVGAVLRLRDALPGATARGYLGYAWGDEQVRGEAQLTLERGSWLLGARAGRQLISTNLYGLFFDNGTTISGLFGRDNHDYIDQWFVGPSVAKSLTPSGQSALRAEVGLARDGILTQTQASGPIAGGAFAPNAPSVAGTYLSTLVGLDWNRNVSGRFAASGQGGFLTYEGGVGDLDFHRVRGRLSVFRVFGPWMFISRLDAGVLASPAPPPQLLFRFGGIQALPGYDFKQFAGDRAVLGRVSLQYNLPLWKKPIMLSPPLALPGFQPAISAGIYSGWSWVSGDGVPVLQQLGWATTNGPRATVDVRLRFFGSAFSLGAARPLDPGGRWRFLFAFGDEL